LQLSSVIPNFKYIFLCLKHLSRSKALFNNS
jgi:hypothetical protein